MAGMRDAKGQREVLALRCKNGTSDYIAIEFCDNEKELQSIGHRFHKTIVGLELSVGKKVANRLARLRSFYRHFQ